MAELSRSFTCSCRDECAMLSGVQSGREKVGNLSGRELPRREHGLIRKFQPLTRKEKPQYDAVANQSDRPEGLLLPAEATAPHGWGGNAYGMQSWPRLFTWLLLTKTIFPFFSSFTVCSQPQAPGSCRPRSAGVMDSSLTGTNWPFDHR